MLLAEYEKHIKNTIDSNLRVVPHPHNDDMAGIYWKNAYICAIPSVKIFPDIKPEYQDKFGHRHRTIPEAESKIKSFMFRLNNEEGFYELMTTPVDEL